MASPATMPSVTTQPSVLPSRLSMAPGDSLMMAAFGDGGSNRRLLQAAFSGEQQPSPASLGSVAIHDQNKQEG
ncbi:hypothetical protein L2E82_49516 [Cichorium intybus]|uniref:Uncharacterized protein n=1 Tax=Cichorium intybus TaxID=13427 RepID=A0ACB8Z0Z9_CICIN|nr:hypothetical protein L2E82_49516 [Cichorium intybus]